jgi:hypothetical protein
MGKYYEIIVLFTDAIRKEGKNVFTYFSKPKEKKNVT